MPVYGNILEKYIKNKKEIYRYDKIVRINESKSTIDNNYKPKGKKNLLSFKKVHITETVINKYKKEYPFLKHVRCKDTKEYICDGYIWFDNDELVAMVGSCEYTDDKTKWVVSLEITKKYKGYGLSKQILDYATKTMNCKYLSVNKNNKIAKKVYDDYGFKVYQEDNTMYYMTIDKNIKESYIEESSKAKISYSDKFSDVEKIVNNLPDTDRKQICNGEFKKSPYVKYRNVLLEDNNPVSFIEVYELPQDKGVGYIVVATLSESRKKGYSKLLVSKFLNSTKAKQFEVIAWKYHTGNDKSLNFAKSIGFDYEEDNTLYYEINESYISEANNESYYRITYGGNDNEWF